MSNLPSKAAIFRAWRSWLDERGIDWGEPSCWACGEFWWGRYDRSVESDSDFDRVWEAAPLERCHIVAPSLDGTDDPENLFLLCRDCHDRAPNTTSREGFLRWVMLQRGAWWHRRANEMLTELEAVGLTDPREVAELLESPEVHDWVLRNTGMHWANTGKRGPRLTPSSLAIALLEIRNQRDHKK